MPHLLDEKAKRRLLDGTLQPLKLPQKKGVEIKLDFILNFPHRKSGRDSILVVGDRATTICYLVPCVTNTIFIEAVWLFWNNVG